MERNYVTIGNQRVVTQWPTTITSTDWKLAICCTFEKQAIWFIPK